MRAWKWCPGSAVSLQNTYAAPVAPNAASNLTGSGRQRATAARLRIGTKLRGLPADHRAGVPSMSPGESASPAATAAASGAEPACVGNCGRAKRALPRPALTASSVQRTGPMPSSSTRSLPALARSDSASSTAVPTVGWPANGSSRAGVKMRSRARCPGSAGANTKTVSGWLNSRAIACMASPSSPCGSSTTASGLPAKRRSVNTSSVANRRRMKVSSVRLMIAQCEETSLRRRTPPSPRKAGRGYPSPLPQPCQSPLIRPASMSSRLKRRASAPPAQA